MLSNEANYINECQIRDIGLSYLTQLKSFKSASGIVGKLIHYQFGDENRDDNKIWLACVLALKAVSTGNFGIGALLTNSEGIIVSYGYNEVFSPYFRSDRHAEMVVLTKYEEENREIQGVDDYTLYTSLEPCPMCLARLIISGIGTIKYAAVDLTGGMVHVIKKLPEVWLQLASRQTFIKADCSVKLSETAKEIFLLNADELNRKLEQRYI